MHGGLLCIAFCMYVCMGLLRVHYTPLQRYMGYLCTRKAQYAPPRRNMHHGAQGRLKFSITGTSNCHGMETCFDLLKGDEKPLKLAGGLTSTSSCILLGNFQEKQTVVFVRTGQDWISVMMIHPVLSPHISGCSSEVVFYME